MGLNERDELARMEIERLTKEATASAAALFNRLCELECVTPKEIRQSYQLFHDAMAVTALDVLGCCKMPYAMYRSTERWKVVRDRRLARDNFRCQDCGDSEFLSVHHETYENRGLESLDDLVTLCDKCHCKRHGKTTLAATE